MNVVDLSKNNSLLNVFVKELRDVTVQGHRAHFRHNLKRIGEIMAYEISKTLEYRKVSVTTPLATSKCHEIADHLVIGTLFRAGIPMHDGMLGYFDDADNAFVSAFRHYHLREPEKFDINIEYIASPRLDGSTLIIADPMLATGSSMDLGYRALLTRGTPAKVHFASVIASRQAVEFMKKRFPDDNFTLWVAAVDDTLNDHSYIVPGLGDAGDLAYGQKE